MQGGAPTKGHSRPSQPDTAHSVRDALDTEASLPMRIQSDSPSRRLLVFGALVLSLALTAVPRTIGASILVRGDGDLQQAINLAQPGDTIYLEPGVTYVGNFVLP